MIAAVASAALSLLFPAPVVAVAADGPWVAVAEGRSAHDCDRVSIWITTQQRVVKLGRRTSCERTSTGNGIAKVTIARNRALWLHFAGGNIREWSLWTATTTAPSPRRLAFVTAEPDAPAPIVIGGGDFDRRQGYGDGDALPYAIGRKVVVLTSTGKISYTWEAPARVTALDTEPGVLAAGLEDGRVFVLVDGKVVETHAGSGPAGGPVTSVGLAVEGVAAQRGRIVEYDKGLDGLVRRRLRVGERAVFGVAFGAALLYRGRIEVQRLTDASPLIPAVRGSVAWLDNWRFTYASGRRVTTLLIPQP